MKKISTKNFNLPNDCLLSPMEKKSVLGGTWVLTNEPCSTNDDCEQECDPAFGLCVIWL